MIAVACATEEAVEEVAVEEEHDHSDDPLDEVIEEDFLSVNQYWCYRIQ